MMKIKNYSAISLLTVMIASLSCISSASAQTQKEIQKAVDDAIAKATAEIVEEMKKEAQEAADLQKGDITALMKKIYPLFEAFNEDFGTFPAESCVEYSEDIEAHVKHLAKQSSNRYLAMLIACGYADAEQEVFFSPPFPSAHVVKADKNVRPGKILEAGECSFTYNLGLSLDSSGTTPLLLFPMVAGKEIFDFKACNGKAYVLRVDGSITTYEVSEDGKVIVDGKSFFDPAQKYWEGKMNLCFPIVKQPE